MKFEKTKEEKYVYMGYEKEQEIATPKLEMHFIELPKFRKKNKDAKTKLEKWLWLLSGKEEMVKVGEKGDFELSKAIEELKKMNLTETEEEIYEARQKAIWDYNSQMLAAKEDGFEQGRKEGLKQGKKEGIEEGIKESKIKIVKKLLKIGMDIPKISEVTELKEEEIEEIKKIDKN